MCDSNDQLQNKIMDTLNESKRTTTTAITSNNNSTPSLETLVVWNISKARLQRPNLDLKSALMETQEQLSRHSAGSVAALQSGERHLTCALLAWQQLGHTDVDSLCRFVESKTTTKEESPAPPVLPTFRRSFISYKNSLANDLSGPVLKLPLEPKVVMHVEHTPQMKRETDKTIKTPIEQCVSLESSCVNRLIILEKRTKDLHSRIAKLAKREADRIELLTRAEAAWQELEAGYQRRYNAILEKEQDISRETSRVICERAQDKETCAQLVESLTAAGKIIEEQGKKLSDTDKVVCAKAVERMRTLELALKEESKLADAHSQAAQEDRDLKFELEQNRRKQQVALSELESVRVLSFESERSLRAELSALRDNTRSVTKQVQDEEKAAEQLKKQIEDLESEKNEIIEDLEGCHTLCDADMQGKITELAERRQRYKELQEQVIECKCKLPATTAVEVKRTPSFAAFCMCSPEEKALESCSCTSLRTQLLSQLLSDLFEGLQSELNFNGTKMPCQLLKCLEDTHNWDRASVVKSNLRNYFSQLLAGELDIAIATSIEKYHSRWIGRSCADLIKKKSSQMLVEDNTGWETRAMQQKAAKMASEIAEKMFQERADELMKQAKARLSEGPLPCECGGPQRDPVVYQCMVEPRRTEPTKNGEIESEARKKATIERPPFKRSRLVGWRRAVCDVSQLRSQLYDLKRECIKKGDLRTMEKNIAKIVQEQLNGGIECYESQNIKNQKIQFNEKSPKNKVLLRKKDTPSDTNFKLKYNKIKKNRHYAVNMCYCNERKKVIQNKYLERKSSWKNRSSRDIISQVSSFGISANKPIKYMVTSEEMCLGSPPEPEISQGCGQGCCCFNKTPSCTSLNRLLRKLTKWKDGLDDIPKMEIDKYSSLNIPSQKSRKNDEIVVIQQSNSLATNNDAITLDRMSICRQNALRSVNIAHIKSSNLSDCNVEIPINTESVYMGTVNLERSNENWVKDMYDIDKRTEKKSSTNLATCGCALKHLELQDILSKTQDKSGKKDKKTHQYKSEIFVGKQGNRQTLYNQKRHQKIFHDTKRKSKISEIINKSHDLSNGCLKDKTSTSPITAVSGLKKQDIQESGRLDYMEQIKFLGVTIANATSNSKISNICKDKDKINKSCRPSETVKECIEKKVCEINSSYKLNIKQKIISCHKSSSNNNLNHGCQCNTILNEIKAMFNNALQKNKTDCNEDKSLNTSSVILNVLENKGDCVCCNTNIKNEECKNLEVNTFCLIEEYLKKRFAELKANFPSSCIDTDEEHKAFVAILDKVKQIIGENTSNITCKCDNNVQSQGSWQRAYSLMQEYLKTKINRLQCKCLTPKSSKQSILPDLATKVCDFIEKDFQRLQEIWKNKSHNLSVRIKPFTEQMIHEVPEKDTNSEHNSFQSMIHLPAHCVRNASVQLTIPNLENKSCEAMEKADHIVKATGIQISIDQLRTVVSKGIDCSYSEQFLRSLLAHSMLQQNNEIHNEIHSKETQNLEPEEEIPKKDPEKDFKGYTIDCVCNNDNGSCFCPKSMVKQNNAVTSKVWKTYVEEKKQTNIFSYIMDNVDEKNDDIIQDTNIHDIHFHKRSRSSSISDDDILLIDDSDDNSGDMGKTNRYANNYLSKDNNTSTEEIEDIVLKKSLEKVVKVSKQSLQTNTAEEEITSLMSLGGNDPIEWYETSSQTKNSQRPERKSVRFSTHQSNPHVTNEIIFESTSKLEELHRKCKCNMVPLCHVKMLVDDIENKLVHYDCTCDSLSPKVCPVHSNH